MKKIFIVNGEKYWQEFFPDFEVIQKAIQDTSWILKNGDLFVADADGVIKPDAILWRIGAIRPSEIQRTALNLIEISNIPCVNSAYTLKRGYDRLSMLATLRKLDMPVINFNVVTKSTYLKNIDLPFPFVVKAGNYHGGYGKVLIENEEKWQEVRDLLFVTEDYITTEPYINYVRDIRYLAINDKVWAMSRRGKYWKANTGTVHFEIIKAERSWVEKVQILKREIRADIVAIDLLEEKNGKIHIVEYNDIPGLSGFSDELKYELASTLIKKLSDVE